MEAKINQTQIIMVQADITKETTNAIVNTANSRLSDS
jgi:O-acetyl-ADP-ribose deacetylase (regulator of RNase III)